MKNELVERALTWFVAVEVACWGQLLVTSGGPESENERLVCSAEDERLLIWIGRLNGPFWLPARRLGAHFKVRLLISIRTRRLLPSEAPVWPKVGHLLLLLLLLWRPTLRQAGQMQGLLLLQLATCKEGQRAAADYLRLGSGGARAWLGEENVVGLWHKQVALPLANVTDID